MPTAQKLVLVTGVTGYIGGRLVPELLKAGYAVRALARHPERLRDLAFGAALATAAYTAILLVLAAIDTPGRFTDAITIIFVICAFFALLLVLLYLIAQAVGRVTRRPGR